MDLYSINGLVAIIIGIFVLLILLKLFIKPIKIVSKIAGKFILGGIWILILNFILGVINIALPLNFITMATVGFLGLPGAGLIYCLSKVTT